MHVPIIDFKTYDPKSPRTIEALGESIGAALSEIGFMSVTNLPIDDGLLREVFSASQKFFASETQIKAASAYQSAAENFGYQGMCEENLNPSSPADLKETFTMRNVLNKP